MSDPSIPAVGAGKRRIALNTAANGVAQAATVLVSIVFLPLLVHALGLAPYGLFMLSVTVSDKRITDVSRIPIGITKDYQAFINGPATTVQ